MNWTETPQSLIDDMLDRLSRKFQLAYDEIVLSAIRARIGDVPLESLRGRLSRITYTCDKRDEWYLDGDLMLTMYEPATEHEGNWYEITQTYRLHESPSRFWCNTHNRHCADRGCHPSLAGVTAPCRVVDLKAIECEVVPK